MLENAYEWRRSPVFPNDYLVSRRGSVYSIRSKKELRPSCDKYGYIYFVLCVNGVRRTVKAHRLVAKAFIPNPNKKPTVNHKNGIRNDNRVENLEWATSKEQSNDPLTLLHFKSSHGKDYYRKIGAKRNFGRKKVVIEMDGKSETYQSLLDAANAASMNYGHLSEIINGKRKQKGEFTVRWAIGE